MSFNRLSETLTATLSGDSGGEIAFRIIADNFISETGLDRFRGGYFNRSEKGLKTLAQQVELASQFTIAGSYLTDACYSRLALFTLDYILEFHQLDSGHYATSTHIGLCHIDFSFITHCLDSAQLAAFVNTYGINQQGLFDWTQLTVKIPASQLAEHLQMHPKQVPLALDGALQIIAQSLPRPLADENWNLALNLQLCEALFRSAMYLKRPDHADTAATLYNLCRHQLHHAPEQAFSTAFQYLCYQWQHEVYDDLQQLHQMLNIKEADPSILEHAELLIKHLDRINNNSRSASENLQGIRKISGTSLVLILGPGHEARHWLQLADHQYQPGWRYVALPQTNANTTRAILLQASGKEIWFESLNDLLSCRP